MSTPTPATPTGQSGSVARSTAPTTPSKTRILLLVRHGETTYNIERRIASQLPGIMLTDEGRRQAQRAAVALSALPVSAIVSSPLERAVETAEIIARGWGLPVRTDPRLMDTDVGHWAGRKIDEVTTTDPGFQAYVANPDEPPAGVESFSTVQERAVAAAQEALANPANGDYIVLVSHSDVIKLILAQYLKTPIPTVLSMAVGNASISGLAFTGERPPKILATNWTPDPHWLVAPAPPTPPTPPTPEAPYGSAASRNRTRIP